MRSFSGHVHHRLNGGCHRILTACLFQDRRVQEKPLTSFARQVNALLQHRHLVSGVVVKRRGLFPRTASPLLDKIIPRLGLSLQPFGFQDFVDVVQVLLCGEDLGVAAHLTYLALDCFDFAPLESLLQGRAGWRRQKRREITPGQESSKMGNVGYPTRRPAKYLMNDD